MGAIQAEPLVQALEHALFEPGEPLWASLAKAIRAVGLEVALEAAERLANRVAAGGDYDSPDFWSFGLGGHLGHGDPELGWEFICRLVELVSGQALYLVGASQVEDFCWAAAPAFIDRIEAQAESSSAFHEALGEVWPYGAAVPPEVYARIRKASEAG
jgi:hypothetical protein